MTDLSPNALKIEGALGGGSATLEFGPCERGSGGLNFDVIKGSMATKPFKNKGCIGGECYPVGDPYREYASKLAYMK